MHFPSYARHSHAWQAAEVIALRTLGRLNNMMWGSGLQSHPLVVLPVRGHVALSYAFTAIVCPKWILATHLWTA